MKKFNNKCLWELDNDIILNKDLYHYQKTQLRKYIENTVKHAKVLFEGFLAFGNPRCVMILYKSKCLLLYIESYNKKSKHFINHSLKLLSKRIIQKINENTRSNRDISSITL